MSDENKKQEAFDEEVLPIKNFHAAAFIVAIVLVFGMGMYFLNNIDISYAHKLVPDEYVPVKPIREIPKHEGTMTPGVDIEKLGHPSPELISKGKELYNTNCSSCHGEKGYGDGPGAAALNPKPRNYHLKVGWKNGRTFDGIFKTLAEGIPGTGMNSYSFLSVTDRFALIHYIRTFEPDFPPITSDELKQLDAVYNLSQGTKTPSTIPVPLAVQKQIDDAKPMLDKVANLKNEISSMSDPGATIFKTYTKNRTHALTFLLNNEIWKTSYQDLMKQISYEIPENGFKEDILTLKQDELKALYEFLKGKL